jgi:hypothetical protein
MPYPTYGAYVLLTQQTPPSSPTFVAVPIDHEDSWQNAGYTVQWWLFAGMTLFAFGWQARKEAQIRTGKAPDRAAEAERRRAARPAPTGDRVEEADRKRAAAAAAAKADAGPTAAAKADAGPTADAEASPNPATAAEEADRRLAAQSGQD